TALFEAICLLPWYAITRAELALLATHGRTIRDRVSPVATLVELGPGNGAKLSTLLDAADLDDPDRPTVVHLVDISPSALEAAGRMLMFRRGITVVRHQADYEVGLGLASSSLSRGPGRTLALFLGSNIGNFDPPGADAFLRSIRSALA